MDKISELTISLHCGSDREVVNKQMDLLANLNEDYKIHWNNRIDRHPGMYSSYSELVNHAIATSKTEWLIFINDRVKPTPSEIKKMISLLEDGYALVMFYNVAFMGFSKELVREIGWWDERFLLGGWEDRDWVFRIRKNNLAIYESLESTHDYSWKSELNKLGGISSGEFWQIKWDTSKNYIVFKNLPEKIYHKWNMYLGERNLDLKKSWKTWDQSILNLYYGEKDLPHSGPSGSEILRNRKIFNKPKFGKKIIYFSYRFLNKFKKIKI